MAKIVHWGKHYPPDMGGIESVTCSLAQGARRQGHSVCVVCFGDTDAEPTIDDDGVEVIRVRAAAKLASQPLGWRYFRLLLREGRQADIVHLHAPNMLAALASVMLGKRPRLVVHWHSDVIDKGLLGHLLRPLETMLLRRADRVICTSPPYFDASQPLKKFSNKVVVIPLGAPDRQSTSEEIADQQLPDELRDRLKGRQLILSIGRLVPYKGFEHLIDAAAMLPADTVVVIVGSGPLKPALDERVAKAGLQDRVILAGRLNDQELRALFARSEIYCMSSVERSEAFGVVLIEAMSWQIPIVATEIPGSGVPWVNNHGESGLNVTPGNSKLIANALTLILDDKDLQLRLALGARQRFEREFIEEIAITRIANLYESLIRN